MFEDENFIEKYILNNEQLMDKLLLRYAQQLAKQSAPTVIANNGVFGTMPSKQPATVQEAGNLATRLFK